ncbi:hypothetical protein IscW_ISCW012692 [Ixodes scapularis]|uniref:Uncharacterized protein n=1 Tax=Ixodes scapularis TaxID=6945 RepID=B7QGG4_IXOSC|nr:hypothetical protein IscW_ISCW012692 [Ixodes scapularis]|eukprot:XP_002401724.1 hypothetical protein IscW_ISCW012692 [Ixodes scapularis]
MRAALLSCKCFTNFCRSLENKSDSGTHSARRLSLPLLPPCFLQSRTAQEIQGVPHLLKWKAHSAFHFLPLDFPPPG